MILENLLSLVLYLICILLPGWFFCYLVPIKERYMRLAMSYGLGTAVLSGELFFYFFIFKLDYSFWLYLFLFFQAFICLLLIVYRERKLFKKNSHQEILNVDQWKIKEFFVATLIGVCIIFSVFQAVVKPTVAYDSVANWSKRSKILERDDKINFNSSSNTYLAVPATASYPWHTSLSEYWLRKIGGGEISVNFLPVGYFIGIIMALYYGLSKKINRFPRLVLVLLFSSMPLVSYHSFNTYADLPLAYFVSIATVLFINWQEQRKISLLFFSAFFIGWGIFVKNDGLFPIIAWLVAFLLTWYLFRTIVSRQEFLKTLGFLFGPIIMWLGFKYSLDLGYSSVPVGTNFHPEIFFPLLTSLFIHNSWNIWWFIFFTIVIVKTKYIYKNRKLWPIFLFFVVLCILTISVFLFTEYYQYALNFTAIQRTMIPLIPISILLVGLALEENDKVPV
jgi:hypothetical protein